MIYYLKHNIHKLNWTMIGNVLGMVLIAQACLMVLPVIVDLIYQEGLYDSYLIVIGICLVLGYGLTRKKVENEFLFCQRRNACGRSCLDRCFFLWWITILLVG